MKCPKCGVDQIGTNLECASCGLIFAKFDQSKAASERITYQVVKRYTPWKEVVFGLIILGAIVFFVTQQPRNRAERDRAAQAAAGNSKRTKYPIAQMGRYDAAQHLLGKACMDDALNGGLTELQARAMCYDDPEAKKQVKEARDQPPSY